MPTVHPDRCGSVPHERWLNVCSHRERLLRLARVRVGDDAEDVVQEAMLRAATFENLDEERLGELLTAITVRLCVDEHRRRNRTAQLQQRMPADRMEEPGADEQVCARAEAEWAAHVVRTLPTMQRAVVEARADGLTFDEIAERHDLSYKAVESLAARARSVVRRALAGTLAVCVVVRRHVLAPAVTTVACAALMLGADGAAQDVGAGPTRPVPTRRAYSMATRAPSPVLAAPRSPAGRPSVSAVVRTRRLASTPPPSDPPVLMFGSSGSWTDRLHSTDNRLADCIRSLQLGSGVRCGHPKEGRQ
jgi:RNA polymerase sigma-70 factor (ECF subfamily)